MTTTDDYDPFGGALRTTDRPSPRLRLARPLMGEEEVDRVREVLESGILTNGPWTRRFERAMANRHGTRDAVAFANGTVALAAMLLGCDIGPGDEVIVPSLTFISTATSVLHVGATPVFADIDEQTGNLDPSDAARRVTSRTRAIVPVHYGGQAADLAELGSVASDAGAVLLEDAAEAHGASYHDVPVGGWGRAAMFSFTPTKNITTGEGGVVTTDDEELAGRLRLLRNHGMTAPYRHDVLGYNWRLSEIHAAIGCAQLDRLDGILATKRRNAALMADLLGAVDGVAVPTVRPDRDHTYMLYTVRIDGDRRDRVMEGLAHDGIETRVYFPPAHRQPIFAATPWDLPRTDRFHREALALPFHAQLSRNELTEVADAVARHLAS